MIHSTPTHTCPVCGYDKMPEPPEDYEICACCGTEFTYRDNMRSMEELRGRWASKGFPWFDDGTPKPHNWDPIAQLQRAGFSVPIAAAMPLAMMPRIEVRYSEPIAQPGKTGRVSVRIPLDYNWQYPLHR
jgi:hypothetical protein